MVEWANMSVMWGGKQRKIKVTDSKKEAVIVTIQKCTYGCC
jgi:hypothetical protein